MGLLPRNVIEYQDIEFKNAKVEYQQVVPQEL